MTTVVVSGVETLDDSNKDGADDNELSADSDPGLDAEDADPEELDLAEIGTDDNDPGLDTEETEEVAGDKADADETDPIEVEDSDDTVELSVAVRGHQVV